jgi:transcriptional regulator with XRE-family HTH domain
MTCHVGGASPSVTSRHVTKLADKEAPRIRHAALFQARKEAGFSARDTFARAAGVSPTTVERAEKGVGTFETVERLARVIGRHPWEFWIPLDETLGPLPEASDAPPPSSVAPSEPSREDAIAALLKTQYAELRRDLHAIKVQVGVKVDSPFLPDPTPRAGE